LKVEFNYRSYSSSLMSLPLRIYQSIPNDFWKRNLKCKLLFGLLEGADILVTFNWILRVHLVPNRLTSSILWLNCNFITQLAKTMKVRQKKLWILYFVLLSSPITH
jgi:hypothetical protein